MHWHAINRSAGLFESSNVAVSVRFDRHGFESSPATEQAGEYVSTSDVDVPIGLDNAADSRAAVPPWPLAAETTERGEDKRESTTDFQESTTSFQMDIPSFSPRSEFTTLAYQRALRTRIRDTKLQPGGGLDIQKYTPTFIHDSLMLPGSLSNLLDKPSPEPLIARMTPALLPGFHAHIHADTHQPCIQPSPAPDACLQGMLILGQGRRERKLVHRHYRLQTRRVQIQVEVDLVVEVPRMERRFAEECWRLRRRSIWAHVWIWAGSSDFMFRDVGWTLEDYIGGTYSTGRRLRIEADGEGDESKDDDDANFACERAEVWEKREVVYGGCGLLEYERGDEWTGW